MAVDLGDLVENLKLEVNPPGGDLFPGTLDTEWIGRLANAFWNGRLDGITALTAYVEVDGSISPASGDTDMPRELQQVLVFLAGYAALMQRLSSIRTSLRAKAGPAEFETQNSATVLHDQAVALRERLHRVLARMSDLGTTPDLVIDAVQARTSSIASGTTSWVR